MASVTMTASFLTSNMTRTTPVVSRRGLIVAKANKEEDSRIITGVEFKTNAKEERNNGRRDLVFATAAAVAAVGFARMGVAEEEPKRGTLDARKKYGPICVTMPTARICHK